jgi:hypothetical protein
MALAVLERPTPQDESLVHLENSEHRVNKSSVLLEKSPINSFADKMRSLRQQYNPLALISRHKEDKRKDRYDFVVEGQQNIKKIVFNPDEQPLVTDLYSIFNATTVKSEEGQEVVSEPGDRPDFSEVEFGLKYDVGIEVQNAQKDTPTQRKARIDKMLADTSLSQEYKQALFFALSLNQNIVDRNTTELKKNVEFEISKNLADLKSTLTEINRRKDLSPEAKKNQINRELIGFKLSPQYNNFVKITKHLQLELQNKIDKLGNSDSESLARLLDEQKKLNESINSNLLESKEQVFNFINSTTQTDKRTLGRPFPPESVVKVGPEVINKEIDPLNESEVVILQYNFEEGLITLKQKLETLYKTPQKEFLDPQMDKVTSITSAFSEFEKSMEFTEIKKLLDNIELKLKTMSKLSDSQAQRLLTIKSDIIKSYDKNLIKKQMVIEANSYFRTLPNEPRYTPTPQERHRETQKALKFEKENRILDLKLKKQNERIKQDIFNRGFDGLNGFLFENVKQMAANEDVVTDEKVDKTINQAVEDFRQSNNYKRLVDSLIKQNLGGEVDAENAMSLAVSNWKNSKDYIRASSQRFDEGEFDRSFLKNVQKLSNEILPIQADSNKNQNSSLQDLFFKPIPFTPKIFFGRNQESRKDK